MLGPPAQEGLQQRSEWPRILHSAVHAHKPNRKEKHKPMVAEVTQTVRGAGRLRREACKMNALLLGLK